MALKPAYGTSGGGGDGGVPDDGSVTTVKLGPDAVTSAKLADNAVGREHLQDDAVGTDEIEDGAVTSAKLADEIASVDDAPWSAGSYAPNTIVLHEAAAGQGIWYLQAGVTDTTAEPPASPWVALGHSTGDAIVAAIDAALGSTTWQGGGGGGVASPRFVDHMHSVTTVWHSSAGISGGAVAQSSGFGAAGLFGVNMFSSTTSTLSGARAQTVGTVFEAAEDLVSECVFMIPSSVSTKSIRIGFGDSTTATDPTDGSYIIIVDGTASYFARAGGSGSAHGTTGTAVADTWYRLRIHWTSATTCSVRLVTKDLVTTVLSLDGLTGLPSGTQQFGHGIVAWLNTGTTAVDIVAVDSIAYDIIPGYDIDA